MAYHSLLAEQKWSLVYFSEGEASLQSFPLKNLLVFKQYFLFHSISIFSKNV